LKDFAFIFEGIIKMSFSLTANGFIYTDANNQTKSIVIDGANNTIDFQQLNISTPSISNKEYVAPQSNFQPADKAALETAVQDYVSGDPVTSATAIATYGEINTWDTSLITDMSNLFDGAVDFNDDISSWNTSSVTSMEEMFFMANNFNQDISSWDVGAVTTFQSMWTSSTAMLGANGDANRLAIHTAWNGNASWSYQWGGNNNP